MQHTTEDSAQPHSPAQNGHPTKPDALRVIFENIPDDLTQRPQWVLWRYEYRADQKKPWTKPPFHPNGRKTDVTNPQNWSDFATVRAAYERGGWDGIGFALDHSDNRAGVDMDAQRVGDGWSEAVKTTAVSLCTYGEVSPSGAGVRFFGRGELPKGKRKNGDFEIYNSGRYLTVTGHRLEGTPPTVNECGAALLEYHACYIVKPETDGKTEPAREVTPPTLDDNTLLDKARSARNGDKFALLWDGGTIQSPSEDDAALCSLLAFWTRKDAAHMERLLRSSGRVREKWNEPRGNSTWILNEIENAIQFAGTVYNPKHHPLCASDPFQVAAQNLSDKPQNDEPEPLNITLGYPTTDTGNAERFIDQHGRKFLHSAALGWMVWDGRRWAPDERGEIHSWEKRTVRSIYAEAQLETDERRPVVAKWAASSESASKRAAMMEAVQKDGPRAIPSDFDRDKWLFNVANGTLDLCTGELRPHQQRDLLSKLSPIRFDARATCPLWTDTLLRIFDGDEKLVRFVQLALGYALTGLTREQCFFVLFGKGANGKSLILSILREVLGDYQKHTPPSTLMQKRGDAIPNDVAMLRGARLVTSIETNEGRKMDEALVKALTGDDPITARFFRQEFFTFTPEFKIFLATNHKPQIVGTDDGIWRRIRLIPFDVRFWDADKGEHGPAHLQADKTLPDKLRGELSGILNWALDGCLAWQRDGIPSPDAVRDATGKYRDECDPIAQFFEDCAALDERHSIPKGDLHKAFTKWVKDSELTPMSTKMFGTRLKEKGFADKLGTGGARFWLGISLISPDSPETARSNKNTRTES